MDAFDPGSYLKNTSQMPHAKDSLTNQGPAPDMGPAVDPNAGMGNYGIESGVQNVSSPDSGSMAASIGTGAATGAMAGGPWGAAIGAGGAFLTQFLAQHAADERAKRQNLANVAQEHGQQQQGIISNMMNSYRAII